MSADQFYRNLAQIELIRSGINSTNEVWNEMINNGTINIQDLHATTLVDYMPGDNRIDSDNMQSILRISNLWTTGRDLVLIATTITLICFVANEYGGRLTAMVYDSTSIEDKFNTFGNEMRAIMDAGGDVAIPSYIELALLGKLQQLETAGDSKAINDFKTKINKLLTRLRSNQQEIDSMTHDQLRERFMITSNDMNAIHTSFTLPRLLEAEAPVPVPASQLSSVPTSQLSSVPAPTVTTSIQLTR